MPSGLSEEFAADPRVVSQWQAFTTRNQLSAPREALIIAVFAATVVFRHARRVDGAPLWPDDAGETRGDEEGWVRRALSSSRSHPGRVR